MTNYVNWKVSSGNLDPVTSNNETLSLNNTIKNAKVIKSNVLANGKLADVRVKSLNFENLESIEDHGMFSACMQSRVPQDILDSLDKTSGDYDYQYASTQITSIHLSNGSITNVNFPKLTTIGDGGLSAAFAGCMKLTGDLNFANIETVNKNALCMTFANTSITSASFPELKTVKSYGMVGAFTGCDQLSSISFPKLETIEDYGMKGAFSHFTMQFESKLTDVSFPELKTIGDYGLSYAFINPIDVSKAFPKLETVGSYAFQSVDFCENVSFPALKTIGSYAFKDANFSKSTTISFPALPSIGENGLYGAFSGCTGLTSVSFPALTSIGSNGLHNAFFCTGLTSISFPELTSIGSMGLFSAFFFCTGLTSVSFPVLTSTGDNGLSSAFQSCTGLTSVSFPELTTVEQQGLFWAFAGCTGLTSVSFPELTTVEQQGLYYAFNGCTNLKEVHFPAALSGNSQCTASYMGCTNATVYFDL